MGYGLLNLGSLLLGLISWAFPVINLAKRNKFENKNWAVYSIASISLCAISLFMQMIYHNHLVKKEDWSALMDTSGALVFVSAVLLTVTLALNIISLAAYRKNKN